MEIYGELLTGCVMRMPGKGVEVNTPRSASTTTELHARDASSTQREAYLLLGVGPAGNLNNHVEDGLLGVGIERDIVEGRDGDAILLDVDAVLQGVGSADLADGVVGSHGCD